MRILCATNSLLLGLIGFSAFLGIWALLSISGLVPSLFLPSPLAVVERFIYLLDHRFAGGTLLDHLWASMLRFAGGFGLAVAVGVPLGLLMGWFRLLDDIVTPLFDAVRFIAPIAWVPFAALWFGTGIGGPIMIIFAGAFPPCLINAYRGAKFADPRLIEAARMLGTPDRRVITEVLLPSAVPSIIAGLRISAGLGWQSLVGAELIVASTGIGYMMVQGQGNVSTTTVMAGMIGIGIIGLIIDVVLRQAENAILRRRGLSA
ncbi:ABC transporter permease [Paracoccus siganidrum]|uniref:ABC transporter permease n=1 Tax=Paracoccus siganidrum TaxID=1276757 RepID=A0A419ACN0_9RHOB|nr:ABC transporter permease [Paracoccus siganidrum]RJL22667.1 ABC transporter permease [Paracoccus siganidrum]RMC39680.1 ABC transporter permease [Paracoccus siganidrum]